MTIKQRLHQRPGVMEAAVGGLPHSDLGEEFTAVVVLEQRATATTRELAEFVGSKLVYIQSPTRWWLRDQPLTTNATGKVGQARVAD